VACATDIGTLVDQLAKTTAPALRFPSSRPLINPIELRCSLDQSTLLLSPRPRGVKAFELPMPMEHASVWFHIPPPARPFLRAAHTYGTSTDGIGRMFPPELVSTEQLR
jgi:hypothetical protein